MPLEVLQSIPVNLCEVILGLLHNPSLFGATKNFSQPDGHLGRDAALSVYKLGKRITSHAKGCGSIRDTQAQRRKSLAQNDASGMWRVFHAHAPAPFSRNRHNQHPPRRRQNEKSLASWPSTGL